MALAMKMHARSPSPRPFCARWSNRQDSMGLHYRAGSLIPETIKEMEADPEWKRIQDSLKSKGQKALTREEQKKTQRSLDSVGLPSFAQKIETAGVGPLVRGAPDILQLNIGLYCNQACTHCHVESSPKRTELMSTEVAARCLELLDSAPSVSVVDITGGAPELCPAFRDLVLGARERGREVIDRCNLTVLLEPGQEDTAQFLADNRVRIVASLPCYSQGVIDLRGRDVHRDRCCFRFSVQKNVDAQRGSGVFDRSIKALQILNGLGYGRPDSGLELDLVYNPGGAFLAPPQSALEETYRQELREAFGIEFTRLLCLNNMPIKRFHDWLSRRGGLEEYMSLLVNSFNPGATKGLMCRNTVSVGWDGSIFDCDFNQQLDLPVTRPGPNGGPLTVFDIESLDAITGDAIRLANHCYGCTAGCGSSCQGATE